MKIQNYITYGLGKYLYPLEFINNLFKNSIA